MMAAEVKRRRQPGRKQVASEAFHFSSTQKRSWALNILLQCGVEEKGRK